ncbi:MAG: RNA polymerase sigma-70 factor [Tannerellaceae bacterium]|jgi:RNA polymerase sigma-70 factor (ECF subfamily)|nr:RNA polymerase sigma-70 factor [Tannerellaceae bacterium]
MDNQSKFGEIYTRHYKPSFLFVKSYVNDDMAAEDIVSEALISLWRAMKTSLVNNPTAMLVTILRNESLNYLKREYIRRESLEAISQKLLREMNYRISSLEICNPEEIFSAEISEIVARTLATLSPKTVRIFEMSRYEQQSVREIAQSLNLSPKSVEYHITQALRALRLALKEYLPLLLFLIH